MAKNLVIVESPAKAKTIGKFLGTNYKIKSSVGHIRDLPKSKLGIDIENEFDPQYITIRGKGPLLAELKKEAKKADKVYLATDPDREGEAISWHLAKALNLDLNDLNRIEFNEITKTAVKNAIKHPRKINQDLVDAQQARRVLDRLVGYKISPLLWKKVMKGLSAGRVQSVVTKIVCEREKEISEFVPEEYWSIEASLSKSNKKFVAKYHGQKRNGKISKLELKNKDDVDQILGRIKAEAFEVENVKETEKKRNPYPPYTTSTLQQDASKRLGFTTKKTMQIAQQLYEGVDVKGVGTLGLITYIRTDSYRLSDEALQNAKEFILNNYDERYYSGEKRYSRGKKDIQDAHEAIRPSYVEYKPLDIKESLSRDQYKLYNLIWQRFLASQMSPAIIDNKSITFNNNDEIFKSSGSVVRFDGFMKVFEITDEDILKLPEFEVGDVLKAAAIDSKQHFTKPPARYTEASLIKVMEELGIGRPSTYAPTIATILARRYVSLEAKQFYPTELGILVTELLDQYFTKVMDKEFTAKMEDDLDEVEEGTQEWRATVKDFYQNFEKELVVAEEEISKIEIKDEVSDIPCDKCGSLMVKKRGKFGEFLACPNYPECKNTKPIIKPVGVKCPKCKQGEIIEKLSKKGRKFYGCDQYPECDFVSWDLPSTKPCPECQGMMIIKFGKNTKTIKCTECDYNEKVDKE